ncbi:MAG: alpha/beta fold hydrolase [Streptosporangiaceae bacterium]
MERLAASGGISLACATSGDPGAPPVVLLHGLGERAASWQPVIPAFGARYRVFALDMRGHGDSDWPGVYSFQLMCDDVIAVLGGLGLGPVTLVGHSMGGAVALLAAMQQPGLVARLVIEDATPPYPRDRAVPGRPDGQLDIDWPVVPALIGAVNAGDPAAWAGLAVITAPTLLVGGGPRSHVRQDKLAEAAARIPRCELVTIDAGHNVHADRPAEFAATVLGWLGSDRT